MSKKFCVIIAIKILHMYVDRELHLHILNDALVISNFIHVSAEIALGLGCPPKVQVPLFVKNKIN